MSSGRKKPNDGKKSNEKKTPSSTNWIVAWSRIQEFIDSHPEDPGVEQAFLGWYQRARHASLESFHTLKTTFPGADLVSRDVAFDIGGNKYRLVADVKFGRRKLYVLQVMTHKHYDSWKPRK